jgi:hypothetical protein
MANAPFYRLPKNGGLWQALAPLPIPPQINAGGGGDLGYLNGSLYTFARRDSSSSARALYSYDIAANAWTRSGPMAGDGADIACVPLAENRILGGWVGWTRLKEVRDRVSGQAVDLTDLSGGAAHPWDGCAGEDSAWFLKHREQASGTGVLARIPRTGSPVPVEIAGLPFNPGIGCAIEAVPGQWFADRHERIFILRGGGGTNDGDGGGWTQDTTNNQLAIYDVTAGTWSLETLPFPVGDGSEMARVDDTLFILASRNAPVNPLRSFRFADVIRPPQPRNVAAERPHIGSVRFRWFGNPGQAYALESSHDLANWTLIRVLIADDQGLITQDGIEGQPKSFYRVSP